MAGACEVAFKNRRTQWAEKRRTPNEATHKVGANPPVQEIVSGARGITSSNNVADFVLHFAIHLVFHVYSYTFPNCIFPAKARKYIHFFAFS
jgi:hypothetical protein